jgi:signal transduction histidine kinase
MERNGGGAGLRAVVKRRKFAIFGTNRGIAMEWQQSSAWLRIGVATPRLTMGFGLALASAAGGALLFTLGADAGIPGPAAKAVLETLMIVLALAAAVLFIAAFWQAPDRRGLGLVSVLAGAAATDLVFRTWPAIDGRTMTGVSTEFGSRAMLTLAFAATALLSTTEIRGGRVRAILLAVLAGPVFVIGGGLLNNMVAGRLGRLSGGVVPQDQLALFVWSIVWIVLLMAAGILFLARSGRGGGLLMAAMFAFAGAWLLRLHPDAAPSTWVTPADGLRLCGYALLPAAATVRFLDARRSWVQRLLVDERTRIARDLHDGLAQDLAYIAVRSDYLESDLGVEPRLALAARRALATSRGVMVDLAASAAPTTGAALELVAAELARRFDARVTVRVEHDPRRGISADLDQSHRDQVVRIAREAIVNAIQNGGAGNVEVVLDYRSSRPLLRVCDDGRGILESEASASPGMGLRTMHERAFALGGQVVAGGGIDGGTEIKLVLD